jgi:hypothetical protein
VKPNAGTTHPASPPKASTTTLSPSPSPIARLTSCIAPQLAAVDHRFGEELRSELACVNTLVKHVSRFRG